MPAYLIVRAEVPDPEDRPAFDAWYRDEHLPDALKAFSAKSAWRGWSDVEPQLHYAFYAFDSLADVQAVSRSEATRGLIAEFDRHWQGRVTRTRDVVRSIQSV